MKKDRHSLNSMIDCTPPYLSGGMNSSIRIGIAGWPSFPPPRSFSSDWLNQEIIEVGRRRCIGFSVPRHFGLGDRLMRVSGHAGRLISYVGISVYGIPGKGLVAVFIN